MTPEQQAVTVRREALRLSRARAVDDLRRATAQAHRQMLERAIRALDDQLAGLDA